MEDNCIANDNYIVIKGERFDFVESKGSTCVACALKKKCGNGNIPCSAFIEIGKERTGIFMHGTR